MWKRVIAPTVVVSVLWIAVSSITTYYVSRLIDSHARTIAENLPTIEGAWAMRRDVWKLQVAVLQTPHGSIDQMRAAVAEVERSFQTAFDKAKETSLTAAEQAISDEIRDEFQQYRRFVENQVQALAADPQRLLTEADRQECTRLALAVTESCRKLSEVNQQLIADEAIQNERLYVVVVSFRMAFLILGPMVGLALGFWIARRLRTSIAQISVTLKDVTGRLGGGLGLVAVSNSDDLPMLREQVQTIADRIRQVVGELDEARQRVIQSERLAAVGELAASVAHEIRNPLTSVKLLIQTAAQASPARNMNGMHFEILLKEISRMEATIQGLLDFARPPRPRAIRHDVCQTVRRAINLLQARAQMSKVAIIEDFPAEPVYLNGDPDQLHSVFVNLGINAIEAMTNGGSLKVAIAVRAARCLIEFRDTGAGIPLQLLERVFEPFVTGKERGTGLGLAISRRIVEEHEGTLTAANSENGGAILTVDLALSIAPAFKQVEDSVTVGMSSALSEIL